MSIIQDIIAALGATLSGVSQAILAITFGFAMMPSALAYVVGILGCVISNSTVPISFQAETIVMAGNMGKTKNERISMIIYAGAAMALIGVFGLLESIVDFAGQNVVAAMMAGVGIILTKLSLDICQQNKRIGYISMVIAVVTYVLTTSLVYTFVACIVLSSIIAHLLKEEISPIGGSEDKFVLQKPTVNFRIIRGALALVCLTIGGNIAFGGISASISGTTANFDHISIYSGLADVASGLFGGSPISVVIAPTAAAPHPKLSAIFLMVIMIIILLTKSLPKLAKFIPSQSVAGTLFILGAVITIPDNLVAAFSNTTSGGALACSVAMAVTAISDPFFGLAAGILVNLIAGPLGL